MGGRGVTAGASDPLLSPLSERGRRSWAGAEDGRQADPARALPLRERVNTAAETAALPGSASPGVPTACMFAWAAAGVCERKDELAKRPLGNGLLLLLKQATSGHGEPAPRVIVRHFSCDAASRHLGAAKLRQRRSSIHGPSFLLES